MTNLTDLWLSKSLQRHSTRSMWGGDLEGNYQPHLIRRGATLPLLPLLNMVLVRRNYSKLAPKGKLLLMKRNSFVYAFRAFQIMIMAFITMTLFLRTNMHRDSVTDGGIYMGAIFFSIVMLMFNGFSELSLTLFKLPIFFKQRNYLFYPSWAYAPPNWILKIPISLMEVAVWVFLSYYVIGFDPSIERLFKQYLLLILVNQMASGLFQFIAVLGRELVVANTIAAFGLLVFMVLGGFILSHGNQAAPLMYAQMAVSTNEFLGKSWNHIVSGSHQPLGLRILKSRGMFTEAKWYWIGVGALIGYTLLFNLLFDLALAYLKPFGKSQPTVSEELLKEKHASITRQIVKPSSGGRINSDNQATTRR